MRTFASPGIRRRFSLLLPTILLIAGSLILGLTVNRSANLRQSQDSRSQAMFDDDGGGGGGCSIAGTACTANSNCCSPLSCIGGTCQLPPSSTVRYTCNYVSYQCGQSSSGTFATLSDCQSYCNPPSDPPPATTTPSPSPSSSPVPTPNPTAKCYFGASLCELLTPMRSPATGCNNCPVGVAACCGDPITDHCTQGFSYCDSDGKLRTCRPDHSGYEIQNCASGFYCQVGQTRCQPLATPTPTPTYTCTTNGGNCSYGVSCAALGKVSVSGTCQSGGYCCGSNSLVDNCTQGISYCDGSSLKVCRADKSGYDTHACNPGYTCASGQTKCQPIVTPTPAPPLTACQQHCHGETGFLYNSCVSTCEHTTTLLPNNSRCSINSDCQSNNCQAAPGGKICLAAGQTLTTKVAAGGTCGTTAYDRECVTGYTCQNNTCKLPQIDTPTSLLTLAQTCVINPTLSVCNQNIPSDTDYVPQTNQEMGIAALQAINAITFGAFGNYVASNVAQNQAYGYGTEDYNYWDRVLNYENIRSATQLGTTLVGEAAVGVYAGAALGGTMTVGTALAGGATTANFLFSTANTASVCTTPQAFLTNPTCQMAAAQNLTAAAGFAGLGTSTVARGVSFAANVADTGLGAANTYSYCKQYGPNGTCILFGATTAMGAYSYSQDLINLSKTTITPVVPSIPNTTLVYRGYNPSGPDITQHVAGGIRSGFTIEELTTLPQSKIDEILFSKGTPHVTEATILTDKALEQLYTMQQVKAYRLAQSSMVSSPWISATTDIEIAKNFGTRVSLLQVPNEYLANIDELTNQIYIDLHGQSMPENEIGILGTIKPEWVIKTYDFP